MENFQHTARLDTFSEVRKERERERVREREKEREGEIRQAQELKVDNLRL